MTRLRIGVEQLGAEGFRLELAGPEGATNVIALAPGGGIQGRYAQDDVSIGLHGVRASTLALSELTWALSGGQMRGSGQMHDVEIEATIAVGAARGTRPGFVGTIRAGAIEATVDLRIGDVTLHGAHVRVEGFALVADPAGKLDVRIGSARASTIRGSLGTIELHADDIALPDLATLQAGTLRLEAITVGTLRVELPRVGAAADEATPSRGEEAASGGEGAARPRGLPPLPFLDLLHGHVNVDVTTDVSLPIIGGRQATHRFRVPIADGVIELKTLSKSLATLESLVLAFAVREDRLVLEKDIPLVPFDNQPLVHWTLDAAGIELAARDRVRLSTLLRPELAAPAKREPDTSPREKGKGVQLRRIEAEEIDVVLAIRDSFAIDVAGGTLELGGKDRPAVGELRAQGSVGHRQSDPPEGRITASATEIHLSANGVQVGKRRLDIGALQLELVQKIVLAMVGLRPRTLSTHASGVSLKKVELSGPPREG